MPTGTAIALAARVRRLRPPPIGPGGALWHGAGERPRHDRLRTTEARSRSSWSTSTRRPRSGCTAAIGLPNSSSNGSNGRNSSRSTSCRTRSAPRTGLVPPAGGSTMDAKPREGADGVPTSPRDRRDLTDQDDPEGLDDIFAPTTRTSTTSSTDLEPWGRRRRAAPPDAASAVRLSRSVAGRAARGTPTTCPVATTRRGSTSVASSSRCRTASRCGSRSRTRSRSPRHWLTAPTRCRSTRLRRRSRAGCGPRSEPRSATSLNGAGGSAEDAHGPFGTELRARIPIEGGTSRPRASSASTGRAGSSAGLLTGPASTDPAQAKRLESAFRDVVVQRGTDAMAPRDMLPLHLPRDAREVPPPPEPPDRSLQLPVRGPEITEIQ